MKYELNYVFRQIGLWWGPACYYIKQTILVYCPIFTHVFLFNSLILYVAVSFAGKWDFCFRQNSLLIILGLALSFSASIFMIDTAFDSIRNIFNLSKIVFFLILNRKLWDMLCTWSKNMMESINYSNVF